MRHDLIVADQSTIPSLPEPLRQFVTGMVEGEPTCRRELTVKERADVQARLDSLKATLTPATPDEAMTFVMKLLLAFPSQELSEAAAKYRSEGYLTALLDVPAWAIQKGCGYWLRREFREETDNYAFAPSPPQLSRLCKIAVTEARYRERQFEAILKARPDAIKEQTEAVIQKRIDRLKALSETLSGAS